MTNKKKNLLSSWLSRHVTPPALNEKNMTPAKTMHPGLLHPAFSPSLSGRGEGGRLREGRRGRGWQKQLEGEHGGGGAGGSQLTCDRTMLLCWWGERNTQTSNSNHIDCTAGGHSPSLRPRVTIATGRRERRHPK